MHFIYVLHFIYARQISVLFVIEHLSILTRRIVWAFSSAWRSPANQRRLSMCMRLHPRLPTCRDAMCISRMPIGTRGKFAGTRGRRGNRLWKGIEERGRARWGGVRERWCSDDIWKRHRQTYREEARVALPGRTPRFVAFVFASWCFPLPPIYVHIILSGNPSGAVDFINTSLDCCAIEDDTWNLRIKMIEIIIPFFMYPNFQLFK